MENYIALLRGINVSGQKIIKMADLREYLKELKFDSVQTYIQSGNIVFKSKRSSEKLLEDKITKLIKKSYGFVVPVMVVSSEAMQKVIHNNPYSNEEKYESKKVCITFLSENPKGDCSAILDTLKTTDEEFQLGEKVIYLYLPNGNARTKLTTSIIEKKLGVRATARNWRTTNKLLEMCRD